MANPTMVGTGTLASPVLPGGMTNASIDTNTARPYSLATRDVASGLQLDIIQRKLQLEATLDEVFLDIGSDVVFTGKKVALPGTCIMRLSSGNDKGARTQVIPIENPATGPGVSTFGTDMRGNERSTTLQYMKVYYNEYAYGLVGETFGVNYNDLQVFQYYGQEQPKISRWFAEDEGKQYRQALLERVSWPLEATPTSIIRGTTVGYNPNWFIANTEFGSQPVYDDTPATFRANITNAFAAAATGTSGVNANIDLDYLLHLDNYAQNQKRIRPVMIGGKKSYVVLLPTSQYYKLLSLYNGQLGSVWQNVTQLSSEEQNFPGIVGRVKSLVIIEDQRYPTITCANNYANATHNVQYVNPGNDDSRNKSVYAVDSNASWDIGFLMGDAAIVDWTVTPLQFRVQEEEYGKRYGKSAFVERGIQLGATFDTDTVSNKNLKNFGSIVLAFTSPSSVSVA